MLSPGANFGPYEVLGLLGAGGMGEVYRARDARLNRDVALKVLPDAVARDPERVARFTREAQALAALSHPQIATIFGVEQRDGQHGLVMELVEGPTLAERLQAGPMDWREALALASQIANAISAAHERGIVHRDLKPANIKLTPEAGIKILDFGLAKAIAPPDSVAVSGPLSESPTFSVIATGAGVLLGTAAYMSPEQARSGAIDRRTDVWAFGCVLFEMLAGKQAFAAQTVSDTLAAVLRGEPQWGDLPTSLPNAVIRVLKRCLDQDRRRRLADLADARFDIEEALSGPPVYAVEPTTRRNLLPLAGLVLIACASVTAGVMWIFEPWRPEPTPIRFSVALSGDIRPSIGSQHGFVWAVDGQTLYFAARTDASSATDSVYKISLQDFGTQLVAEGFHSPFVSPDGRWLGMNRGNATYKMPIAGGTPVVIPGTTGSRSLWSADGRIIFSHPLGGLVATDQDGGEPVPVHASNRTFGLPIATRDNLLLAPLFPGGNAAHVAAIDLSSGNVVDLGEGNAPGVIGNFLTFTRTGGVLWVAPFDRSRRRLTGPAVPLVSGLMSASGLVGGLPASGPSAGLYAVSHTGHLAYVPGERTSLRQLVWVDRAGVVSETLTEPGAYSGPRVSPDGSRLAVSDGEGIWIIDLARSTRVRLGSKGLNHTRPVWTADGNWVVFLGSGDMFRQRSDGSGTAERILDRSEAVFPDGAGPEDTISFNAGGGTNRDMWLLRNGKAEPLLVTQAHERGGMFSPSGNQIAYVSDESGRDEVYVQRFPGPSGKAAASTRGGQGPMWSRDGRELFYREADRLMSVRVMANGDLLSPVPLFTLKGYLVDPNQAAYDVGPDGKRFIFVRQATTTEQAEIRFVLNWLEEVKVKLRSEK